MHDVITFQPLYKQRVWGGTTLESELDRTLPEGAKPCGESWEIVDREDDQSVVTSGSLEGKTLQQLWSDHREDIFGSVESSERFPLLFKVLDARSDLSIQVHPPQEIAADLGGEPKTEMWYIAHADPGAKLYVGLNPGVDEDKFRSALKDGTVEDCVNVIEPKAGDSIFIPSGRLHAIGAGLLIYEIQQNSDTTYRVYDWGRKGLDGKLRELHVEESLKCIDFTDVSPQMDVPQDGILAKCEYFTVSRAALQAGQNRCAKECFEIVTVLSGEVLSESGQTFKKGDFFLLPSGGKGVSAESDAELLVTTF